MSGYTTKIKDTEGKEHDYYATPIPVDRAISLAFRLFDVLAEPLGPVAEGLLSGGGQGGLKAIMEGDIDIANLNLSKALPALSGRLLANQELVWELMRDVHRDGEKLDKGSVMIAYTGNLRELGAAVRWVIQSNRLQDFFQGFGA